VTGFPGLGLLRRLRPTRPVRLSLRLSRPMWWLLHRTGPGPGGSRVHRDSLVEGGARLCPSGIAVSTPQTFLTASRTGKCIPSRKFTTQPCRAVTHRARPISTRF